jgi:hypothetical protein
MSWTKVEPKEVVDVTVEVEGVEWKLEQSEKNNAEAMADIVHKISQGKSKVRKEKVKADMVNNPPHYTSGGIETIDYIKAKLTPEEFMGYLKGNVIKYTSRAGKKDDVIQDLEKAQWYMSRQIKVLIGG